MIRAYAKWKAKHDYILAEEKDAAMKDLNASAALYRAGQRRKEVKRMNAEAQKIEDTIKEVDEKMAKGFWQCECGRENLEVPAVPQDEGAAIHCECGKAMKLVRTDLMTGQEKYEAEKERNVQMAAANRQAAKDNEEQIKGHENAAAMFRKAVRRRRLRAQARHAGHGHTQHPAPRGEEAGDSRRVHKLGIIVRTAGGCKKTHDSTNPMKVAFDIDDTLWKVRIRNVLGRVVGDQVPDYDIIQVLRWFAANGDDVYVWSAGGIDYAQQIVDKLGLSESVTVVAKQEDPRFIPDLTFDDEAIKIGMANCRVRRPDYEKIAAELQEDAKPADAKPNP
jgi:hypothetical protein